MAANTKKKNEKAAQRAREDKVYSYILSAFALCIVLELFLIPVYRALYFTDAYELNYLLHRWWWLALVPAVGCGVWAVMAKRGDKKFHLPAWGAVFFLLASLSALLCGSFGGNGAKLACIGLPVAAVLYCVYLVYQHEFFLTALSFAGSIVSLWAFRSGSSVGTTACIVAIAVIAVFAVFSAAAAKNAGMLWPKGPRFFKPTTGWALLFLAYGLSLLALAGTLAFGAAFAYVAIFAMAGLVFIAAVYYTVKIL